MVDKWFERVVRFTSRKGGIVSLPLWAALFGLAFLTSWGVVILWVITSVFGCAITGAMAQMIEREFDEDDRRG